MKFLATLSVIGLTALSAPAAALAQTVPPALAEAIDTADAVVEAEIFDVDARWSGGLVVSTVHAEVRSCLRGSCPAVTVSYEILGGELDGVVQVIEGSVVPRVGQAVVLLLVARQTRFQLASMAYGTLPIVTGTGGEPAVRLADAVLPVRELRRLLVANQR